jgi:aldose 1-epimerase
MTGTTALPRAEAFQKHIDGKTTGLVILRKNNLHAAITNYGARWVSLLTPDKNGTLRDVIVGFESVEGFIQSTEPYYGATIGRCANRIKNGIFYLDGKKYTLATNNGPSHLHGGIKGFQAVVWDFEKVAPDSVMLSYRSADGEEGYPGNVLATVTYTLMDTNEMQIEFNAQTDKTTIVNLTNHAYFNLNGQGSGTILNHTVQINAGHYTPMDANSIPFGEIAPVDGTPFDFRQPVEIGARINEPHVQLQNGIGYDHNFVLQKNGTALTHAATAVGDDSGIKMDVFTTEPGLQFYTGNFMDGANTLKTGAKDGHRTAFCFETQHFPDAPNHADFPSVVLYPGDRYHTVSRFRFSAAAV